MICDMLIVGGDGDLAFRKLYPALYHLDLDGRLSQEMLLVSVSRSAVSEQDFADRVALMIAPMTKEKSRDEQVWLRFRRRLRHSAIDATSDAELAVLSQKVFTDKSGDLVGYLATPPAIFAPVCKSLWAVGLVRRNMRIVIEKPLGSNLNTFRDINKSLAPLNRSSAPRQTVRGQYAAGTVAGEAVPAYRKEPGAGAASDTETFVVIKAEISNWRWAGVPFYLCTGKRMQARFSEIVVQFNQVPHAIFHEQLDTSNANRLVIRLQPNEGIRLHLLNKVPGLDDSQALENLSLNLSLSDVFTDRRVPDACERLLYDVMRSNSTLFMRADQVEAAWQ